MKKMVIIILMMGVLLFGISGCKKSEANEDEKMIQETQEKYGFVQKETVEVLVAKFNTEVASNSQLNVASLDYLTESNNQYWYGLIEGVSLVVVPSTYTGDFKNDIVDYMLIFVSKSSEYASDALLYAKCLVKANNEKIDDEETDFLLDEAKSLASSSKTANSGKGISVGYLEKDEMYQYQVLRLYK